MSTGSLRRNAFDSLIRFALAHERQIAWGVLLLPLFAAAAMVVVKLAVRQSGSAAGEGLVKFMIAEDGPIEWATAVAYLLAAGFAVSLVLHFRRLKEHVYALLYAILAVGLFFIAMEEISWGQRQLGLSTPEFLQEVNYKHETNFHNIAGFPLHAAFIVIGFYGAFSRPIAASFLGKRYPKIVDLLTPPYPLFLYFFIPFALYCYYEYLYRTVVGPAGLEWAEYWTDQHLITGKFQEPVELLLGLGFLLFTALNWVRYRVGAPLAVEWIGVPQAAADATPARPLGRP